MTSSPSRGTFYRIRVAALLLVLGGVILYALRDVQSRRERNTWDHTLSVALVLLRDPSLGPLAPDALPALRDRLPALDERLTEELRRYRPGAPHPFSFSPLRSGGRGDSAAVGAGDRVGRSGAAHLRAVALSPPGRRGRGSRPVALRLAHLRGGSPAGAAPIAPWSRARARRTGAIGTVSVELDASMADFTLFVATHELFHTLGASDKYDAQGRCEVPDGLAEPNLVPLYPQRFAEVMARDRPLSPTEEVVPASLADLAVGPATAGVKIGWPR